MKISERINNDELYVIHWMMIARLHMAEGNQASADEALDKVQQKIVEGEASAQSMPRLAAARVQYAIAFDRMADAAEWAERLLEDCDWHTFYRFTNTTKALYLLAQNKPEQAASHLERCFMCASQERWIYGMIVIRALQALAAAESETAFKYLEDALTWAQPEGYLRTFVDLGKEMKALLEAAIQRQIMPDYVEKILFGMRDGSQKSILGQLGLAEPIHPRELEVLRLLNEGLTNSQIAEQLVISVGTVKTHVHNICGKLGTRNRSEAAARARQLGLV